MDMIDIWSVKVAEAVAPDEIDLAPLMTQAYMTGGKKRQDLFRQADSGGLGGFGPGQIQAIYPWILRAIVTTGTLLYTLLTSEATGKLLSAVETLLNIEDALERRQKAKELPDNPYVTLKQVLENFSAGLEATGLTQDQRDLLTYKFLKTLLDDPTGGLQYIQEIQSSAH
jgi:hypothetical protein